MAGCAVKEIGGFFWPDSDKVCAPATLEEVSSVEVALSLVKQRNECDQEGGKVGDWAS